MSGFAVVYERSNTPVDPGVLERVMERLSHRGPDGRDVYLAGHAEMGHWHFWTTPEEAGERQPLLLPGMPYTIVMDGRLDNRPEIIKQLQLDREEAARLSDAALVVYAFAGLGEACFEHFIGEFALVIYDLIRHELICARDPLGDRTLFYAIVGTRIVIASEPWATAGGRFGDVELDESAVACLFAIQVPEDGQTLFKGVYELLPAHWMKITATDEFRQKYWQQPTTPRDRKRSDADYAEEFRSLLEESVSCRLRSVNPPGILMSGGLDSTSVACLAAQIMAPDVLTTISYVFDEVHDCDERLYINAVKEQYGIHSIQIPCDELWPYRNWQDWPHNPNFPEGNAYRLIKEKAYSRARAEGLQVLLTGGFGDQLYNGYRDSLADLILDHHYLRALEEIVFSFRNFGLANTLKGWMVRQTGKRVLETISGKCLSRKSKDTPWMTKNAAALVRDLNHSNSVKQRQDLVGLWDSYSLTGEIPNFNRFGIELRHPYRDRRLVEFVLGLPAYQLYSLGLRKYILRMSMRNILPEIIRTRPRPTSLRALFERGYEREQLRLATYFHDSSASWQKYVEASWVLRKWDEFPRSFIGNNQDLVVWLCLSFEKWNKRNNTV